MVFANPTLVSGIAGKVGAVYRFSNVSAGTDATIQIMKLAGGAGLNTMDNTSQGYYNAWQPYVTAGANDTSYLDWKITFKVAGTNTDKILPCLSITAVDIDGDGSSLKEFIVASTPGAYAVDVNTLLNVSFDGTNSAAIGNVSTVPNIDTAFHKYMFQMNFTNVTSIYYRNGSISTKSVTDVRHTCIYFKSFFQTLILLPVKLSSFSVTPLTDAMLLQWSASSEKDLASYAIQQSTDGITWKAAGSITVPQDGAAIHHYSFTDRSAMAGKRYYRLQYTDVHGGISYSRMLSTEREQSTVVVHCPTIVQGNIPVQIISPVAATYRISLYTLQGQPVKQQLYTAGIGVNAPLLEMPSYTSAGSYVLVVSNARGEVVYRTKLLIRGN